jgi:hypothetical protein
MVAADAGWSSAVAEAALPVVGETTGRARQMRTEEPPIRYDIDRPTALLIAEPATEECPLGDSM